MCNFQFLRALAIVATNTGIMAHRWGVRHGGRLAGVRASPADDFVVTPETRMQWFNEMVAASERTATSRKRAWEPDEEEYGADISYFESMLHRPRARPDSVAMQRSSSSDWPAESSPRPGVRAARTPPQSEMLTARQDAPLAAQHANRVLRFDDQRRLVSYAAGAAPRRGISLRRRPSDYRA